MPLLFNALALAAVCATGAMHWFGIIDSLYWTYDWWDVPTHMLGGLTIGLWVGAVASRAQLPPIRTLLYMVGLTLAVGGAWEAWESIEGLSGGFADSVMDLGNDSIGAFVAWMLYAAFFRVR